MAAPPVTAGYTNGGLEGVGVNVFWGFTPSLDLQSVRAAGAGAAADGSPINILVCGGGDIRHLLRTVSAHRRHNRPIKLHVLERKTEHIARQLLLWHIVLDESMHLREREQLFLEVFGNCYLRNKSADYVDGLVDELRGLVTAGEVKWKDFLRVGAMKHKEVPSPRPPHTQNSTAPTARCRLPFVASPLTAAVAAAAGRARGDI